MLLEAFFLTATVFFRHRSIALALEFIVVVVKLVVTLLFVCVAFVIVPGCVGFYNLIVLIFFAVVIFVIVCDCSIVSAPETSSTLVSEIHTFGQSFFAMEMLFNFFGFLRIFFLLFNFIFVQVISFTFLFHNCSHILFLNSFLFSLLLLFNLILFFIFDIIIILTLR